MKRVVHSVHEAGSELKVNSYKRETLQAQIVQKVAS